MTLRAFVKKNYFHAQVNVTHFSTATQLLQAIISAQLLSAQRRLDW